MLKPFVMVVEALNADMKLKRDEAVGPRRESVKPQPQASRPRHGRFAGNSPLRATFRCRKVRCFGRRHFMQTLLVVLVWRGSVSNLDPEFRKKLECVTS
ncbi:hypothetical protein PHSY_000789 [Pseudozyma hubeiensis SY62]|uniref:Uncharacterized protein n=1 Tax=Pseudozyma hubeiensis (strain SY62) TaxID=1305764 RepID=R9NXC6_PSEHS|nr:hypothetical protein PHSY_000789 [Pseudozyma hubeiensis SY62]GAC93226.1 hypothetical protein PHSY_000789 [Pseudozyma hubeiensis SY62]